jgi:hypothetical protein
VATKAEKKQHARHARLAHKTYVKSRTPAFAAQTWHAALKASRSIIADTLRASNMLKDVKAALGDDGKHTRVLRHLMAPPISQDQFKLICPIWSKSSEKGTSSVKVKVAATVEKIFHNWRDKKLTAWLDGNRTPSYREIRTLLSAVAPLIASQAVGTVERNRLASEQEGAVTRLLLSKGWTRQPSKLIDTRAALPSTHFMHKTRFATKNEPQEVDIACGLAKTYVLAMECKVTNDATNSVKRINDVLKKAKAWKDHWGNFVTTAALLQGVIAPKDVHRLLDDGVKVFWSHDLKTFEAWLDAQI